MSARHPFSTIFLLHIALEIPFALQGIWAPAALPILQLNNTSVVFLKLYCVLLLATCIVALLCYPLPDVLPGKRALAIGLCVYHTSVSTILYQAPRFIPHSFGALAENYKVTPEIVWGTLHGIVGLGLVGWWQATVQPTVAANAARK